MMVPTGIRYRLFGLARSRAVILCGVLSGPGPLDLIVKKNEAVIALGRVLELPNRTARRSPRNAKPDRRLESGHVYFEERLPKACTVSSTDAARSNREDPGGFAGRTATSPPSSPHAAGMLLSTVQMSSSPQSSDDESSM